MDFALGFLAGGLLIAALAAAYHWLYLLTLRDKGRDHDRTPKKILGEWFYIVPSSAYAQMHAVLLAMRPAIARADWHRRADYDLSPRSGTPYHGGR